jgi:hypothetical protein
MSTGVRVAAWSTAGLLAMGTAATTADAVAGHHGADNGSSSGQGPDNGGAGRHDDGMQAGVVHGVATVKVKHKFVTFKEQRGTINDINTEALVVTSADEYAATYVIGAHTKAFNDGRRIALTKLADGDAVSVLAKKVGSQFTAISVTEGERHHDGRDNDGKGDRDGNGDHDGNGNDNGDHDGGGESDG